MRADHPEDPCRPPRLLLQPARQVGLSFHPTSLHGADALGGIDVDGQNGHGPPLFESVGEPRHPFMACRWSRLNCCAIWTAQGSPSHSLDRISRIHATHRAGPFRFFPL